MSCLFFRSFVENNNFYNSKLKKSSLIFFRFLLIKILITSIPSFSYGQRLDTLVNDFSSNYPAEKIHVQFDRSLYTARDTIWFKTYLVLGLVPDDYSKNIYVDFSDASGKILAHQTYPVFQGSSCGQFVVPYDLEGNIIHITAYTRWMLNFEKAFLASTLSSLGNTTASFANCFKRKEVSIPIFSFFL